MSNSDELKKHRTAAKGRFTRLVNELERMIDHEDVENEFVSSMFNDVNEAWKNVNEKHDNYMSSTNGSEEEMAAGDQWISEIQRRFYDIRKRIKRINREDESKLSRENAIRVRNVAYSDFSHMNSNIRKLISDNCTIPSIEREREIVNQQFMEVEQCHREVSILSRNESEEENARDWIKTSVSEISKINCEIDSYVMKADEMISADSHKPENSGKKLLLEKLPLPKFKGDIQAYPRFRRDFVEIVLPTLDKRHAPFVLRQCLSSTILRHLNANEDDINKLLERLDEKYGDPGKLTDVIVNGIKSFKVTAGEKLIEFICLIESSYNDLIALSMEAEMCNSNMVSIIESKLPKTLAHQWFRQIHESGSKVDKRNKFLGLLEFLRIERKALEYASSELRSNSEITQGRVNALDSGNNTGIIRTSTSDDCLIHNVNSHKTSECRKFIDIPLHEKYKLLRDNFACYGCLLPGHSAIDCVKRSPCTKNNCDRLHHEIIHPPEKKSLNNSFNCSNDYNNCLLQIMSVPIKSRKMGNLNVFWDSGATVSLISKNKAIEHGLKGTPVTLRIITIGGIERKEDSFILFL